MKRRISTAALVLCLISGSVVAREFSAAQIQTIQVLTGALLAGRDNHCPRFHIIEREVREEVLAAGLSEEDFDSEDFEKVIEDAATEYVKSFEENPSAFCYAAWLTFGPTGLYKRQLLEAN